VVFWGRAIEPHEAGAYGQSVLRGGVVVSVHVAESEAPSVIKLLDSHHPVTSWNAPGLMAHPQQSRLK